MSPVLELNPSSKSPLYSSTTDIHTGQTESISTLEISIFGFFAHLLKDWLPKRGLQSIEQIFSFLQRCCSIVEMCTNSRRHYEFEMFAIISLFSILLF